MKAESNLKPQNEFEIENIINGKCEVVFYDNIKEIEEEIDGEKRKKYEYDIYRLATNYRDDLEIDLNTNNDKLIAWKEKAVKNETDELASIIRAERDKLLKESDSAMCLDRLGIELPEHITATNLLSVVVSLFKTLKEIMTGKNAKYRQALRDIPQQKGFPYNVVFPQKPNSNESEE